VLQAATYICDGAKWHISIKSNGYHLKLRTLAKFAVEQLSINQFVPSVGMAGNAIVAREMLNLQVPPWVVAKAISLDILTQLASYSALSLFVLFLLDGIANAAVIGIIILFFLFITTCTLALWHFLHNHKKWKILNWFKRFSIVSKTMEVMGEIPPEEVIPLQLFARVSSLRIAIFILDALTLYVLMAAIGAPVALNAALIALVLGSIGGIISFLPGGIGGFEALCTGVLVLFGTSVEAALAGTLLLRGFVLWLPLIPGLIFARRQLFPVEQSEG
jgi:Mg2+-importing ATPase